MPPDEYKPDEYKIDTGEKKAWDDLRDRDPKAVELSAGARYDESACTYTLPSFGDYYVVSLKDGSISFRENPCRVPEYLLKLAIPIYLANAKPIPQSGELVKEFVGGDFFHRGAHTLALEELASKYGDDADGFRLAGEMGLGGEDAGLGDASIRFDVFPRVSMTFVLWLRDEEFPARMSLLFDKNAGKHMPLDVVWAAAVVACERMLGKTV
jgi:hypothetical protein